MKSMSSVLLLTILSVATVFATTYNVNTSGFTFSPGTLTVNAGDTVVFTLASIHNAVEVSQSTWNANGGTALAGGFSVPFGGGTIVLTTTGTHYYVCQTHISLGMKGTITVNSATGVVPEKKTIPNVYALYPALPNPFNPGTTIRYELPEMSVVRLTVYNILGQEVARLVDGSEPAGFYSVKFSAENLNSGVYFYRLEAGPYSRVERMILMK